MEEAIIIASHGSYMEIGDLCRQMDITYNNETVIGCYEHLSKLYVATRNRNFIPFRCLTWVERIIITEYLLPELDDDEEWDDG